MHSLLKRARMESDPRFRHRLPDDNRAGGRVHQRAQRGALAAVGVAFNVTFTWISSRTPTPR
jgi:hypothetical protein